MPKPAEALTIKKLLLDFYNQKAHRYASKAVYNSALNYADKYLYGVTLDEFRKAKQEWFVAQLQQQGLADGTVKRVMAAISTSIKRAYEYDLIPAKPHVLTVTDDSRRERVLTDDEARALITASRTENDARYIALALMTGARPMAIIGLSKGQFDLTSRVLRLLPYGEKQVKQKPKPTIPLTRALAEMAKGWEDGPIFKAGDRRLTSNETIWNRIGKSVPGATPYVLRHTVATEMRRQGVPHWDVSGYLGHKLGGVTERYAHYDPMYMRAAADAMDRYWERLTGATDSFIIGGYHVKVPESRKEAGIGET
jgi:integrase